ncbi:MAG: serpin family protein [Bacteroidetes bacterium]|nr:serpin family protein [Bacteroidota bacterium]
MACLQRFDFNMRNRVINRSETYNSTDMKETIKAFLLLAVAASFTSCDKEPVQPDLTPKSLTLTAAAPQAILSSNEFGIELFTRVASDDDDNLMLSPLSASTALTMLLNGCAGDTYTQLQGALKYPPQMSVTDINEAYKSLVSQLLKADTKVTFSLANAIFYRTGFSVISSFLSTMSTDYKATVEALDFSTLAALNTINKWASDNTAGKIPKVLDEISPDAVMFLMNALYFKGDWSYQFDKTKTENRAFTNGAGQQISVSTMRSEVGARITSETGYKAAEMPYGRTNFTMIVIVPDGTLAGFYPAFNNSMWEQITTALDNQEEFGKLIVQMPKLKFSYEKYLNQQLQAMGMVDAFIPFQANLSGITDQSVFVSFVKQNTFVQVDEEGTEAAAVTTIGVEVTSLPPQPQQFIVDKPFLFAIRERTTNTLLFIGQVTNPSF